MTKLEKELKKREPADTKDEIEPTQGFSNTKDDQVFVKARQDVGENLVAGLHQRRYQKSQSGFPTRLNKRFILRTPGRKQGGSNS
ncbi:hypothetical protein [Desulfobacter sp.]|uniref:hypothetical protein n=1 Tax=Desulfobacter sp. TaxID=2294 RepID=UPI00257FF46A|nr:hypothetical protein [Desulfobacter sp.]